MTIRQFVELQRTFSENTFGPGPRTLGIIQHIRQELIEIDKAPNDIYEWIDVVILALDGAWRVGFTPEQIEEAMRIKLHKNIQRKWPDWQKAGPDTAIQHIRNEEEDGS